MNTKYSVTNLITIRFVSLTHKKKNSMLFINDNF